MSIDLVPSPDQPYEAGPDPAAVLALVTANVPLPKRTAAALRLVCHATKLAADENIKELNLSLAAARNLRLAGNPLTSGLTALRFASEFERRPYDPVDALKLAVYNSQTLEELEFPRGYRGDTAALTRLGGCEWPRLRSVSHLFSSPSVFEKCINIDSMPRLTKLSLHGDVARGDVAALARSQSFTSRLEDFYLWLQSDVDITAPLQLLFERSSRLRYLKLNLCSAGAVDLGFLANAELPDLERLELELVPHGRSLSAITCIRRPRLRELELFLNERTTDFRPLFTATPEVLPALEHLKIYACYPLDCSSMREMGLAALKCLKLDSCYLTDADFDYVGAVLAHLPALETLMVAPVVEDQSLNFPNVPYSIFSSPVLPRLRRLVVGADSYEEWDECVELLILRGDKLPQLEEIALHGGSISLDGLDHLMEAGRAGLWPRLKLFHVSEVHDIYDDVEDTLDQGVCMAYKNELNKVWPGLTVDIGGEEDED